jgi:hypothetical protein
MANERKQVMVIKQLLADSLGGMANDYWNSLADFFTSKITKPELDTILLYLTPEQQQLHNKLILNIISNTQQNFSTEPDKDVGTVFKSNNRRNHKHFQTRFNTKTVQSLTKEHKQQLLSLNTIPDGDENDLFKDVLQDPKSIEGIPNTCIEEGDLPTMDALYSRINFISAFQELDSSKDVVDLMNQALEVLLF